MVRVRLASLAVAAAVVFCSGCCCHPFTSLFHRHHNGCDCACMSPCDSSGLVGFEGPAVPPPDALGAMPFTPSPTQITPMPPATIGPAPRIVPIPQANPTPYTPGTPTRWFRN